jgi:hypothetical protein
MHYHGAQSYRYHRCLTFCPLNAMIECEANGATAL